MTIPMATSNMTIADLKDFTTRTPGLNIAGAKTNEVLADLAVAIFERMAKESLSRMTTPTNPG